MFLIEHVVDSYPEVGLKLEVELFAIVLPNSEGNPHGSTLIDNIKVRKDKKAWRERDSSGERNFLVGTGTCTCRDRGEVDSYPTVNIFSWLTRRWTLGDGTPIVCELS